MEYVRCSVGHLLPCISVNVPKTQSWNSCKYIKSLSRVWLFVTPRTVAHQVPLSMGLLQARILEWVDLSFSGDLPNPRIEPRSPALQEDSLPFVLRTPRSFRSATTFHYPSPQSIHLSMEPWFLLLKNGFRNQDLGVKCSFYAYSADRARKYMCVY